MKHSKSSLFLMEMIICILFFSLSAVVCAQLFLRAHKLSQTTVEDNQSVICAQNIAESFIAGNGDTKFISSIFPSAVTEENVPENYQESVKLYYDSKWNYQEAISKDIKYMAILNATMPDNDNNVTATVNIETADYGDGANTIYSLSFNYHIPFTYQ